MTTPTSGAADLPEALTVAVDCWFAKNTGLGGCSDKDVRELADIFRLHALAAGQATAAQQGVAYAALPDEGEPWRGHKFKEVQRGCWRCDCGKTIKEVTSDQSTPASGGNYPVMPKRYTVDDDGEELFTAEKMRAFADATHALRASHGQAPAGATEPTEQQILEAAFAPAQPVAEPSRFGSPELQAMIIARCVEKDQADSVPAVSDLPPLPAPDLRDVGTKPQEIKEFLKGYATEYARTAIAARAPADSVLEDAARLDWLLLRISGAEFRRIGVHYSGNARRADVDAARKQGDSHDL